MRHLIALAILFSVASMAGPSLALELTDAEVARRQEARASLPLGQRIALWAEDYLGTPYDPDPLGLYVRRRAIVTDSAADCMYHTFRSVELALGRSPGESIDIALDKRFFTLGRVEGGEVQNYDERFQYGMDMIRSGKWGEDITATLPGAVQIEGARGVSRVTILPREAAASGSIDGLVSGDIVFFIKDPAKRVVGEVVGHIGILKREAGEAGGLYLIHASGTKNKGGAVSKVSFKDYIESMPFVGIKVSRLQEAL